MTAAAAWNPLNLSGLVPLIRPDQGSSNYLQANLEGLPFLLASVLKSERSCVLTSYPWPSVTVYIDIICKRGFFYTARGPYGSGSIKSPLHISSKGTEQVCAYLLCQHTLTATSCQ